MTKAKVLIVQGKDLSIEDLSKINRWRKKEFGKGSEPISPKTNNEDWNKLYFLIKQNKELVAFGRLHDVEVRFMNRKYKVMGIATMVSIKKHQGFGRTLMNAMKDYINDKGMIGLGFCNNELIQFYKECGLGILDNGKKRFSPGSNRFPEGAAIYTTDRGLLGKMLKNPQEIAYLPRPQW